MHSIFVKWHRLTFPFNRNISSLLENQFETLAKHRCGNLSTPTCDVTMHKIVVPYNSNVCENSLVQWNVWIHRLPRENVITMSPVLVGRNLVVLTFCWHSRCANVMSWHYWTILVGRGPGRKVGQILKWIYLVNILTRASIKNSEYRKFQWLSFWYIQLSVSLTVKMFLASSKWRPFRKFWNMKRGFNLTSDMKRSSQIMQKTYFSWWWHHRWRI